MTKVAVVGSGYVGLVTAAGLADMGHHVTCVDVDDARVEAINVGHVPFHEPGLDDIVGRNAGKRLTATTKLANAVQDVDVIFIAVGTPSRADGSIDLDQVVDAAAGIGTAINRTDRYQVVAVKSTVLPGTTHTKIAPILEETSGRQPTTDFGLVVNPEFLTEGTAVADFIHPDRIVIGTHGDRALETMRGLYAPLGDVPTVVTTPGNAELIKYASNTLLATMISFSNELADLAELIDDADIVEVMRGVHSSRYLTTDGVRAGITSFLEAGCGFGGSCLPKDTRALVALGQASGADTPLLRAVLETNEHRSARVLNLLTKAFPTLDGTKVTVLGLAFKPETNDVRESPAFPIIEGLLAAGSDVVVHDPVVTADLLPAGWADLVTHQPDLNAAISDTHAVVLVTRWEQYRELPDMLSKLQEAPFVVDGRRLLEPSSVAHYSGVGR